MNYGHQSIDQTDIDAVVSVLKSDYLTQGPKVQEFEEAFCEYTGAKYAVAVSSGTAALHLACLTIPVGSCTTLSFVATANAITMAGNKPVLKDIGDDWNAQADLSMDFAGRPNKYVGLIEDACHALGAEGVGHRAPLTCFSFHPVKAITTGEGGMVTTDSEAYSAKLRQLRDHGRVNGLMTDLGYNYRMDEMSAALGLSQLKRLPQFLERRREIALRYCEAFGIPFVYGHAYHLFVILVEDRDRVKAELLEKGIQTQIHYRPIHKQPFYDTGLSLPRAESYYKRCLSLPIYPTLKDEEVRHVIECVKALH